MNDLRAGAQRQRRSIRIRGGLRVITHASALTGVPVRIASGTDDPFHPGVVALADAMPKSAVVEIAAGCHDHSFFSSQQHQSLAFLGRHLTSA